MNLPSEMSTISQWAVYQMCQTLDNNYSYILKIVEDVYPELYSESPTYDWERKSILGCFHKNFSKLLNELSEEAIEKEKQKPFQWSNWKESTDKEILIIDLTHRIPTNWKMYKLYQKNKGNCLDVLDIIKKKYPNFAIPDNCTDDHLHNMMRKIYEKVQMIIDSGCEEKMKREKETSFTWESKELRRNSPVHCPSAESCNNYPTNWDIYQLCKQKRCKYESIVKMLKKKHSDLYIPAKSRDSQLQIRLRMLFKKISILLRSKQSNEVAKEKRTLFTWGNEDSNSKQTTRFSADLGLNETKPSVREETINDSSETSSNSVPVDNLFFSTSPPPHLNSSFTPLPVSQLQTPPPPPTVASTKSLQTAAATSTSSPSLIENQPGVTTSSPSLIENQPGVTKHSKNQNLILAINKFENLISEAITEIAAKDAKIEYLRKEINNVMKNQKKVSSNLKRLQFQHLSQKIST